MRALKFVAFAIAALWILSILWAGDYCVVQGCSGANGNNIDGFLPAFGLAPVGLPALTWSLVIFVRWAMQKKPRADK